MGLFNVVQFENAVCNTTTPGNQGVCYTSSECSNMGGRVAGVCAQGFGVCCQCMYMSEKVFFLEQALILHAHFLQLNSNARVVVTLTVKKWFTSKTQSFHKDLPYLRCAFLAFL